MTPPDPNFAGLIVHTIKEAAQILRWSESTLRRRIRAGEVKVFQSGRVVRITHESLLLLVHNEQRA